MLIAVDQLRADLRLQPGTVTGDVPAEHGSAYDYDRRIGFLLYGSGVARGVDSGAARTIDMAPTLARLAGVKPTQKTDGAPLIRGRAAGIPLTRR